MILSITTSQYIVQAQSIINQFITILVLIKNTNTHTHTYTSAPAVISWTVAARQRRPVGPIASI